MDKDSEILLAHILRNTRVASLGTIRDMEPRVSMVAFVAAPDFAAMYIHVSKLAQHTMDMQKDHHVNLMVAETDDGRPDPQTLIRISIRGVAEIMPAGEPGFLPARMLYLQAFPQAEPLFAFEDFGLWKIIPKGARYVAGLTKAFNLTPEALKRVSAKP